MANARRQSFADLFKSRAAQAGRWVSQARDALAAWISTDADKNRFRRAYNAYNRKPFSKSDASRIAASYILDPNSKQLRARGLSGNDVGGLYLYVYNAKWKDELPYWDMYPLIFLVDTQPLVRQKGGKAKRSPDHFLGLNLHYIQPMQRALLMDAINDRLLKNGFDPNHQNYDKAMHARISYHVLAAAASHRQFRPCIKLYLKDNVRTTMVRIPGDQWHNVLFLPLAKFQKKRESYVWTESARRA